MKILITSGGTTEYIDDVRVLTNISTGKLGAIIAETFLKDGHDVFFIHGRNSILPNPYYNDERLWFIDVKDTKDLMEKMERYVPKADVIIHAMAVSDFTFNRENPVKVKSNDADAFIDYMRDNIRKTPKVISYIKKWNPEAYLVGFKFEVGASYRELVNLGYESIDKNGCDMVVTNDKEEMIRENCHVAHIVTNEGATTCMEKEGIAIEILRQVEEWNR
jgi:phosphopantothenate-cysteine ligase